MIFYPTGDTFYNYTRRSCMQIYIAIISQKNKVCYIWLNIVEIHNANIQLKDIIFA
jgi:hypothetical protein